MKVILILVVALSGLALGQFQNVHRFGGVRPTRPTYNQYQSEGGDRYRSSDDGRYRPELYNRNDANDGRYIPDDSGKYIHMDQPYNGGYGDKGDRGGYYTGDNGRYQHIDGPSGGSGAGFKTLTGNAFKNLAGNFGPTTPTPYVTRPKIATTLKPITKFNPAGNPGSSSNKNYGPQFSAASRFRTYGNEGGWRILRLDKDIDPVSYSYAYETENKIIGEEVGRLENTGGQDQGVRTSGFYEYEGDDGKKYRVDYTADENGFVPKGTHLPEGLEHAVEFVAKSAKY